MQYKHKRLTRKLFFVGITPIIIVSFDNASAPFKNICTQNAIFVKGTDKLYVEQICDYYEDAAHDDAPDSAASLARLLYVKGKTDYKPLWN